MQFRILLLDDVFLPRVKKLIQSRNPIFYYYLPKLSICLFTRDLSYFQFCVPLMRRKYTYWNYCVSTQYKFPSPSYIYLFCDGASVNVLCWTSPLTYRIWQSYQSAACTAYRTAWSVSNAGPTLVYSSRSQVSSGRILQTSANILYRILNPVTLTK